MVEYSEIFLFPGPKPPDDLLECPDPAAGAEVPADPVPRTAGESRAGLCPGPEPDPGEDLVPEQAVQVQEAGQGRSGRAFLLAGISRRSVLCSDWLRLLSSLMP